MTTNDETVTRTLIVKTRGRKWIAGLSGGHKVQLLLDEVTADLEMDTIVTITVAEDLSVRSGYGTAVKWRAGAVLGVRSAERARQLAAARREAEKWVGYAERDLARGLAGTQAVARVLAMDPGDSLELTDRIEAVRAQAPQVAQRSAQLARFDRAARYLGWAEQQVADGVRHSQTITTALELAGSQPELAPRLAALQAALDAPTPERERTVVMVEAPRLGVVTKWFGTWVVHTRVIRTVRITEDGPSVWGAHLLGHEGEQGVLVAYRAASPEEAAAAEAQQAAAAAEAAARRTRQARATALHERIMREGQRPDAWVTPEGEQLMGAPNIMGGGSWFVVGEEWVWAVRNNGADGDTWDANNVRTGGAGAHGSRVPATPALAAELRELHAAGTRLPDSQVITWGPEEEVGW